MHAVEIKRSQSSNFGKSWCANCGSWHSNQSWIAKNGEDYVAKDDMGEQKLYEDGSDPDSDFVVVVNKHSLGYHTSETIYECPTCYVLLEELNGSRTDDPDEDGPATHLCGVCGESWWSLQDAQDCEHPEGTPADPAVFAAAMRED
jgi:hypothetical protein